MSNESNKMKNTSSYNERNHLKHSKSYHKNKKVLSYNNNYNEYKKP